MIGEGPVTELVDSISHLDMEQMIETIGYVGLFIIIFAETGLFFGFFLPGDSLLMTTGLVASRGHLDIKILIPLLIVAAITGDATGYAIGRSMGARLFAREDSRFFKRSHLLKAKTFYDKHGGKTIVMARFLAFARTFAPPVAGAVGMSYSRFTLFNVVGGVSWIASMTLLGFWLGESVEQLPVNPEVAFLLATVLIIAISIAPAAVTVMRERRAAQEERTR